ncbi:MAG: phage baseplate assembly protein V [bacterium]|nr:phage baseplate assembly protein V [bacterium]
MSNAITVTLQGKKSIDLSDHLISLITEQKLNAIPTAQIVLSDGNFADRDYPLFNAVDVQVGAEIDIKIRYEETGDRDESIFKGVVVTSQFGAEKGLPTLTLTVKDPAFRLVHAVDTQIFNKKTDKNMIEDVLSPIAGVSLKKAAAQLTANTYDQFVRKQQSAWDFIRNRAANYGLVSQLDDGAISILNPNDTTGTKSLTLGINEIIDFQLDLDAERLNQTVEINYWDVKKNVTGIVKRTGVSELAKTIAAPQAKYNMLNLTAKQEAEGISAYFSNYNTRNELHGTIAVPGNARFKVMQQLTLKSFPKSYNGSYAVSKVVHEVRMGTWTTHVGIGATEMDEDTMENPTIPQSTPAEIALAMKWEKDPEGLGRIPVKVLSFGTEKYWVYPSQVAAGTKQSSYILPEENEQVIIEFLHGNYNQGYISTSTYLGSNKPPSPFKLDARTPTGFVSSSGMKLIFNDDRQSVELSSSSSNKIELSKNDGAKIISNKNIEVDSKGKTNIKAAATMTLKGATIDLN